MAKILNIIESAYRATLEEQDDTIVWLTHAMKGAGADLTVLLRGNAVNYGVAGQNAAGLAFGRAKQTQPPHLDDDLTALMSKGVAVYAVSEDIEERGIRAEELIAGLKTVSRSGLADLLDGFDQVWHW